MKKIRVVVAGMVTAAVVVLPICAHAKDGEFNQGSGKQNFKLDSNVSSFTATVNSDFAIRNNGRSSGTGLTSFSLYGPSGTSPIATVNSPLNSFSSSLTLTTGFLTAGNYHFGVVAQRFGGNGNPQFNGTYSFVSAVPEPETYAMLLVGLGVVGFAARRKATKGKSRGSVSFNLPSYAI